MGEPCLHPLEIMAQVPLEANPHHMKEKKVTENRQCAFAKGDMLDQPNSCYNEMARSMDEKGATDVVSFDFSRMTKSCTALFCPGHGVTSLGGRKTENSNGFS